MKEYSWSIDGIYKQDANEVGAELEKLGDDLTPENVVQVARDEGNVLHGMFEWNDSIAGEKYRKIQARTLIANIRVTIVADEEYSKPVRAFVTTKRNTNFKPIETVIKDVDQYALLLEKAYKELNAIKYKYESLKEIQELLADIPEI